MCIGRALVCFEKAPPSAGLRCLEVIEPLLFGLRSFRRRSDGVWIPAYMADPQSEGAKGQPDGHGIWPLFDLLFSDTAPKLDFEAGQMVSYEGRPVTFARGSRMHKWTYALFQNNNMT